MNQMRFKLQITRVDTAECIFLLDGQDSRQTEKLHLTDKICHVYNKWQTAYNRYYSGRLRDGDYQGDSSLGVSSEEDTPDTATEPRAKVVSKGPLKPKEGPRDRRSALVKAEAVLLDEFRYWLQDAALSNVSNMLRAALTKSQLPDSPYDRVEVFLSIEEDEDVLARLPWEIWDLGHGIGYPGVVQIVRTSSQLNKAKPQGKLRNKIRLLAIMGNSSGLDLSSDRKVLKSLEPIVNIEVEGWQGANDTISALTRRICDRIADEEGWDVLFFAGHSGQEELTGGELSIYPGRAIGLSEIESSLAKARDKGLQLAIFNSCKGLNIAEGLARIGFPQVVVMRELIHDEVAPIFLEHFTRALANYQDCLEALCTARTALKPNLEFPSADLVPSLYAHPGTEWFKLPQRGIGNWVKKRIPTMAETAALGGLLLLGLLPVAQDLLMDVRVGAQALYRQATAQIPTDKQPLTLVQIDSASLTNAEAQRFPIDQRYLGEVVDTLADLDVSVIGLDYILDDHSQQENTKIPADIRAEKSAELRQAIQKVQERDIALVFGYTPHEDPDRGQVSNALVDPGQAVHGNILLLPWYLELLPAATTECKPPACPFAYQLALDFARIQSESDAVDETGEIATGTIPTSREQHWGAIWEWLSDLHLFPITQFASSFGQVWLHPIIDFSIPPNVAYQRVVAHDLLNPSAQKPLDVDAIQDAVVIVAAGGYQEAGLDEEGQYIFYLPLGISAWSKQISFTGGEAHAYMLHHLLTRHLVFPVPDVWLILLAAWLGKEVTIRTPKYGPGRRQNRLKGGGATLGYGLFSLQTYVTFGIVLPWLLPSLMFWIYLGPLSGQKNQN